MFVLWRINIELSGLVLLMPGTFDLSSAKQEIIQDQYGIRQKSLFKITLEKRVGRITNTT